MLAAGHSLRRFLRRSRCLIMGGIEPITKRCDFTGVWRGHSNLRMDYSLYNVAAASVLRIRDAEMCRSCVNCEALVGVIIFGR